MAMEATAVIRDEQTKHPKRRILIALIGGTLIWVAHLLIVYPLSSLACHWDWFSVLQGTSSQLRLLQSATSIVAALLEAVFIWMMVLEWRQSRHEPGPDGTEPAAPQGLTNNIPFLAFVTALL